MAEVAIPIIALGSLYIASNKNKEPKSSNSNVYQKEGFQNEYKGTKIRPGNLNKIEESSTVPVVGKLNTGEDYHNPSEGNNKFYKKNGIVEVNKATENKPRSSDFVSLTGQSMDVANFRHNNMQPFFGSKVRGKMGDENHESILDGLTGLGSQQIEKQEQAPLFKPSSDAAFINGAPNQNEFFRSRINESLIRNNTKPWEEQRVAPGLNKGYNSNGGDGFNNGMESRDLWQPKDVDDLRVRTNPKQSFNLVGLEGPAGSNVQEMGSLGKIEKHGPDTFYLNNKERWLTTTGAGGEAQTSRSVQVDRAVSRPETTTDYTGIMANAGAGSGGTTYAPQNYRDPHKQQLEGLDVLGGHASNKNAGVHDSYASEGFEILNNNRSTVNQPESTGFMSGVMGSIIAPIMDTIRPSRKANVLKNIRESGNVNGANLGPYITKQDGAAPKTLREINGQKIHLNVQGQQDGAYHVTEHQRVFNQRETTNIVNMGNVSGSVQGLAPTSSEAHYNQRDNPYKESTTYNRFEHGASEHFNNSVNMRTQKLESDRNNNRMFIPTDGPTAAMGADNYSQTTKYPQIGGVGQTQRMDGNLLEAFKKNPYTHSLHSAP